MGSREPLGGWAPYYGRTRALCGPAMLMAGCDGEWEVDIDNDCGCVEPALMAAQLAAAEWNAAQACPDPDPLTAEAARLP